MIYGMLRLSNPRSAWIWSSFVGEPSSDSNAVVVNIVVISETLKVLT